MPSGIADCSYGVMVICPVSPGQRGVIVPAWVGFDDGQAERFELFLELAQAALVVDAICAQQGWDRANP